MSASWWRTLELELERTAVGTLGRFQLGLRRRAQEWCVWHARSEVADDGPPRWCLDTPLEPPDVEALRRYLFRRTSAGIAVRPALADRPVVARPIVSCALPPAEEATVYVSTPIWVEVTVEDPPGKLLATPLVRPSDTWFGPSTWEGELCYFTGTRARLYLENVETNEGRALTEVLIRNRSSEPLELSRISLPVPFLSLFRGEDGGLWTERTTLEHRETSAMVELEISTAAGPHQAELLAAPRRSGGRGALVRAFGAIFGSRLEERR